MLSGPSGPRLVKSGTCPGPVTLAFSQATPNGSIAIVHGPAGSFVKPSGPCAGVTLGISSPVLGGFIGLNGSGAGSLSFNAPVGACGRTVQGVDTVSCLPSNTIVL